VEKQPRTANLARLIAPWLVEGVFIAISVLLGFAAAQYGEDRADRALANRALASLQTELDYNLSVVEPFIAFHRAHIDALSKIPATGGDDSGYRVFLKARPQLPKGARADVPLVRSAAWDAAVSSGALRLLDYDLIASLSEIYQMQDHLGEAVGRIPMSLPAFFDSRDRAASIQLALAALSEIAWAEESLLALYRKHLPAVQAATGRP
jgi:hypothetical protein